MNFKLFSFLSLFLLGIGIFASARGTSTLQSQTVRAAPNFPASNTPTIYSTPTPNVGMTMMFLQATDTIVAIQKTENAIYSQQQTKAAVDFQNAVAATNQAQQAAAAATQDALVAQQQATAQAAAANAVNTANAISTQTAMVGVAATQWYWSYITATQLAATQQIERDAINAKRVSIWGLVIVFVIVDALVILFLAVKVWRSWKLAKAEYQQAAAVTADQNGRFPLVPTDALGRGGRIVNPNIAHRAVIDPDHDDLSTEQALANTQMHLALESTRAIAQSPALMRQTLRSKPVTAVTDSMPDANVQIDKPAPTLLVDGLKKTASWSLIENWNGEGDLPYGVSARGLERVSLSQVPHGGIFGKTGKGKSRYFLRPFIAAAIANGQRVVILGKQADFWPFAQHPNVKVIPVRHITQPEEAALYSNYLKRIVEEMNRRDEYLTANHHSTWDRAGLENTLIVLDELGNALEMMPDDLRRLSYRYVQGLVMEGRKTGFNVWLASQRAVGFKSIVEQLGRAVFYLADADASRYALGVPGAETLRDGHFYSKFHGLRECAAFDPSDEDLTRFLQSRSVPAHEPIDWIEGVATEVSPEPAQPSTESEVNPDLPRILELIRAGETDAAIVRTVWSVSGGSKFYKLIDRVKTIRTEKNTSSSTSSTENGPILDPVAG